MSADSEHYAKYSYITCHFLSNREFTRNKHKPTVYILENAMWVVLTDMKVTIITRYVSLIISTFFHTFDFEDNLNIYK